MTVSFESRTAISAPAELVFDLSRDVDAHLQSQARSREQAVGGVTSGTIGLGEQVRGPFRGASLKRLAEQQS